MNYEALGRRIRAQRKLNHWTQEQLSEVAGISLSFLGHIERGSRKASLETLVSIANALKVSTDVLLQDSLEDNLVGGLSDQFSDQQRTLLQEIANVLLEYDTN